MAPAGASLRMPEPAHRLIGRFPDGSRTPPGLGARAALHRSLLPGRRMPVVLDDAPSADRRARGATSPTWSRSARRPTRSRRGCSPLVEHDAAEHGRLDRLTVKVDSAAGMRGAFEASYRALPADAARTVRHPGLPGGPFTVRIAATPAERDRGTARGPLPVPAAAECAGREPVAHSEEALGR